MPPTRTTRTGPLHPNSTARHPGATLAALAVLAAVDACSPTVKVQAPKEPITINLNIKLDAEVRVKLEEAAAKDIKSNPDIF